MDFITQSKKLRHNAQEKMEAILLYDGNNDDVALLTDMEVKLREAGFVVTRTDTGHYE